MSEDNYIYSMKDRPSPKDFIWIKWLAFTFIVVGTLFLVMGLMAEFIYLATPGEGDSPKELMFLGAYETLQGGSSVLFILGFVSLAIWVASKALDRLDQLIWLKSSQTDRQDLISIKKKKKNAKNK